MATANLLQTSVSGGTQNALSLQGDGVFFPKASTTSRLALTLTTTDKGFVVYDTTDSNIYFWNGTAWESIPSSGDAGVNGAVQYNDNGIVSGASNFIYNNATGLVSLASATITGALTVDTTTLVANAAGYSDKVGVGTATPAATLHVKGSGRVDADYNLFDFYKDNGSTRLGYLLFRDDGPNYFNVNSNHPLYLTTNNTAQVQVETSGDVKINTGNVVMGTSGKGIDFSATAGTGTSELLNDYEEGTWSPSVTGQVNLTSTTLVSAIYTKIGRVVTVSGSVTTSITASNTLAYFALQNLPFTAATIVPGPLWNDSRDTSGTTQVSGNILYGYLPAASGTTTGSVMTINFSNTYTV